MHRGLASLLVTGLALLPATALGSGHRDPLQRRVSIDVQHAPLGGIIDMLAQDTGLNVVVLPDLDREVTLKLDDVSWQEVLDKVLRAYDLAYSYEGGVLLIAPEGHRAVVPEPAPRMLHTFRVSYADPKDAARIVENVALSDEGEIMIDERTRTLIVFDRPENVLRTIRLIGHD